MMITPRPSGGKAQRLVELHVAQQESYVFNRYQRLLLGDFDRRKLRQVSGIEDSDLIHRLYLAGFRADTIMALNTFPVVMTAWASGEVTVNEKRAAELIIFEPELIANGPAIEMFRNWLGEKPSNEWWQLWEEFLVARAAIMPRKRLKGLSRATLSACRKVAQASGGIWGVGKVSPTEQRVINRTRRVFEQLR
jgi:hypothetical protein